MGQDSTAGMLSPVQPGDSNFQLQNIARGMDPQQGSYGAGGAAKMQGAPSQPVVGNMDPYGPAEGQLPQQPPQDPNSIKQLIAAFLQRAGNR